MSSGSTLTAEAMNVLIVDDNIMTITLVTSMLRGQGFSQIQSASNGQDAWDKITSAQDQGIPYDIVIMDWNMPVMSGYDVLRRCREDRTMNRMAIVMLTAENQKRNMLEASKAGATSYIVKPVDSNEFSERMKQVFVWLAKNRQAA